MTYREKPDDQPRFGGPAPVISALDTPKVPAVIDPEDPRGLLPVAALGRDLEVTFMDFEQGPAPNESDLVELGFMTTGGVFRKVDERWYPTNDPIEFPQSLKVPRALLSHGVYEVSIQISIYGNNPNESTRKTLTIDTIKPNFGNKPGAVEFPPELNGTITETFLAQEGEVSVLVPWYADVEPFDRAAYFWTDKPIPPDSEKPIREQEFSAEDVTARRLRITVYADEIRAWGSGERFLYYYLRDRAGNEGPNSFLSTIEVDLTPAPGALRPPRVPLSPRGLVDRQQARDGVSVEVDEYDFNDPKHWLAVFWDDTPLDEVPVAFPLSVQVPWPTLQAKGNGPLRAKVYYKIRQGATYGPPSPEISVAVNLTLAGQDHDKAPALINDDLSLVEVYGQISQTLNTLLSDDFGLPASVLLPLYDAPEQGQLLHLYWGSHPDPVAFYKVEAGDVAGKCVEFSVPWRVIETEKVNPALPVWYTTSNGVNQQRSLPTPVAVSIVVIEGMKEPEFPHANRDGALHCCARPRLWEGVTVRIKADPLIRQGDAVTLFWQGCRGLNGTDPIEGTYEEMKKELTTLHPGEDIDIVVEDYDRLIAPMVNYGSALVYYRLKKSNGVRGTSKEGYVIINRTQPSGAICSPTNDICEEN